MITGPQLKSIFPQCRDFSLWATILPPVMKEFNILDPVEQAEWLAQCGHESAQFGRLTENLNYSPRALMATWPKRFPDLQIAAKYARQPERIANYVYANRMGNGEFGSGDGYRYRGRGLLQITGKENYGTCGVALNLPLLTFPQKLEDPINAARSAGWYWRTRVKNHTPGDIVHSTKIINGGLNGLAERQAFLDKAVQVLECKLAA